MACASVASVKPLPGPICPPHCSSAPSYCATLSYMFHQCSRRVGLDHMYGFLEIVICIKVTDKHPVQASFACKHIQVDPMFLNSTCPSRDLLLSHPFPASEAYALQNRYRRHRAPMEEALCLLRWFRWQWTPSAAKNTLSAAKLSLTLPLGSVPFPVSNIFFCFCSLQASQCLEDTYQGDTNLLASSAQN